MSEYTKEYRLAQLLAKEIIGELTPEEQQELEAWKKADPTAMELHAHVLNPTTKHERDTFTNALDLKTSWGKVERRIIPARKHKSRHMTRWFAIAATVALLAFIGLLLPRTNEVKEQVVPEAKVEIGSSKAVLITAEGKQFCLSDPDSVKTLNLGNGLIAINNGRSIKYVGNMDSSIHENKINVIQVPRGGEFELLLPDGTHVWLNSDSELSFPVQFNANRREVTLTGEAYFSVTRNESSPFSVKTPGGIEVKVLGTQFNIQAYQEEEVIETTLCQGSVRVSDGKQSITIRPNQQAVYVKATQGLTTREVDIRLYTAWKNGLFVFENKPLEEIMSTLARWYNINIFYSAPVVKTYHFTGDLERYDDFRKALNMLEKATSVRFVVNGNNVVVEETTK